MNCYCGHQIEELDSGECAVCGGLIEDGSPTIVQSVMWSKRLWQALAVANLLAWGACAWVVVNDVGDPQRWQWIE